ncbi:hypothetical protein F5B22DRAFT_300427 [Xylaria bambusicola]|uniref:uncharacterized protein n=1 Tax=Xylaria bambusicola TaxID=326684 RepID=UPI002008D438|nr:uncharacterized protein F5B22DRAFT_300427 [Xylaria bambusicola]KAI0512653.1 hypothetical protein F5B22DRAFT_300427 [Xylaria bambusicola]
MSPVADNTSYAPKSPDLSCFDSGPGFHSSSAYYKPNPSYAFPNYSASPPSGGNPSLQPLAPTSAPTQLRPQVQPQQQQLELGSHNFSQPPLHHQYQAHHHYNNNNNNHNYNLNSHVHISNGSTTTATITDHNAYPGHPHQHPRVSLNTYDHTSQHALVPYPPQPGTHYYPSPAPQQQQPHYLQPHQSAYQPSYYSSYADSPTSTGYQPASQSIPQQQHVHAQQHQQQQQQPPSLSPNRPVTSNPPDAMPRGKAAAPAAREPEVMDSPVRTKFPTARIKRIMQADEEVGKVAQQTPIAVGKALELFMVQLVHKSAEVAKEKNSKRITAPMLKQAIDSTNEWDFLREIVAKVTEEKEGARSSGRPKAESESDDDVDAGEVKKKGRGGRKKKAAV